MAKLIKKRYRKLDGTIAINNYLAFISKSVVAEAGFSGDEEINIYAKDGKIIIEKKG